jgi:hypothetical protein
MSSLFLALEMLKKPYRKHYLTFISWVLDKTDKYYSKIFETILVPKWQHQKKKEISVFLKIKNIHRGEDVPLCNDIPEGLLLSLLSCL